MSIFAGPKIVDEGLVFSIDATNRKFISPLGNNSFNGAAEIISSTIPGITVNSFNGVHLGNLNYYTVFAIDYPEGSYGGDAAGRHGMTPGLNVRSGTKTYDASRSLHMWVWNNDTNAWLSSSYFNGFRLSGHCYDNYSGAEDGYVNQINKFIADFNNIKTTFSNCTYIIMGSHRADQYNSGLRAILYDLGMPTGTALDSDYVAAPEWILVGKPGLGAGKAYGWVYQNYTTNAAQVAHLNFALPVYGNKDNYLSLDGIDNYVQTQPFTPNITNKTLSAWVRLNSTTQQGGGVINLQSENGVTFDAIVYNETNQGWGFGSNGFSRTGWSGVKETSTNSWVNIVATYENSNYKMYRNGVLILTLTSFNVINYNFSSRSLVGYRHTGGSSGYLNGAISQASLYNRALTINEIKQNFEATRGRYSI
jgi:hypothetical protein